MAVSCFVFAWLKVVMARLERHLLYRIARPLISVEAFAGSIEGGRDPSPKMVMLDQCHGRPRSELAGCRQ